MSALSPALLAQLSSTLTRPSVSYLLPTVVCTALGHGHAVGSIYLHATSDLLPAPVSRSVSTPLPSADPIPRRRVLREIKEALIKSACLIGVPRVIEALLELGEVVEEGAKDDSFVRRDLVSRAPVTALDVGEAGLDTVYKDDIKAIWKRMEPDMLDVQFLSKYVTYGAFLLPYAGTPPSESPDPLAHDATLVSVVTLSALVPQRTPREILWHLRGAIRNGMSRAEVEALHSAIATVCAACGSLDVRKGMPNVSDVELQAGEPGFEEATSLESAS